jgi:hypothetical protein
MNNVEAKVKATATPVLLAIIAGLITLFGSFSLNYLSKMSDKLDAVIVQVATQGKEIESLQRDQNRDEGFYQEVIKSYAKPEPIYEIPKQRAR